MAAIENNNKCRWGCDECRMVAMWNDAAPKENSVAVPKKLKIELPCDSAVPFLAIVKRTEMGSQRDTCIPIVNTALFAAIKRWKQPKYPSTDKWINKMQYIHTMEYHSAFKKKEILIHVTTCMISKNTVLSEKRQKEKYWMSWLI